MLTVQYIGRENKARTLVSGLSCRVNPTRLAECLPKEIELEVTDTPTEISTDCGL